MGARQFAAIQAVAGSFGVELSSLDVRDAGEIERAITAFARGANGGLIVTAGRGRNHSSRPDHRARGPAPAARGLSLALVRHSGGLISYGPESSTSSGTPLATSTASSRARSQPTCRCRARPNTSW